MATYYGFTIFVLFWFNTLPEQILSSLSDLLGQGYVQIEVDGEIQTIIVNPRNHLNYKERVQLADTTCKGGANGKRLLEDVEIM